MTTIAVIDTETDRFDGEEEITASVIELAVVHLTLGDCTTAAPFSWLFASGAGGVTPQASAVHHLTAKDLVDNPPFDRVAWFRAVDGADYVAAHNAAFDRSQIERITGPGRPWLCTLKLSRVAWPEAPGHSNQVLRYWLKLPVTVPDGLHPHRAAYDAVCTAALLVKLLAHFENDLDRMVKISNEPSLLPKIGFGKHRGDRWNAVPRDYLKWIISQDFGEDEKHTARYWLER